MIDFIDLYREALALSIALHGNSPSRGEGNGMCSPNYIHLIFSEFSFASLRPLRIALKQALHGAGETRVR